MLAENEHINQMLDWYEPLLTVKQLQVMEMYYRDDLSITEIAENLSISRSAVFDQLKRCVKILENYERKLSLVANFNKRREIYQKLEEMKESEVSELVKKLMELE